MPHDMREMLRSYLESMSQDFNVGGLLIKRRKTTNSTTAS